MSLVLCDADLACCLNLNLVASTPSSLHHSVVRLAWGPIGIMLGSCERSGYAMVWGAIAVWKGLRS